MLRGTVVLVAALSLAACAGGPPTAGSSKGYYKVGKPYQIKGVWYYPAEDYSYDETGIGSWYGPGFHAKMTANGETYDEMEMTAAHRTLPMPSLVRVTNLDNGRSIVVRINDRGPYANNRIIDMSRRGAQLLGYETNGTAKVRVQILADESRQIAAAARAGTPAPVLAELDGPAPKAAPRGRIEVTGTP
ncbi:MAG TPA: septal ring lytic transglycosylase RlpA family protein, partial [Azospirillum sp.]